MKKISPTFIILITTFVSVVIMLYSNMNQTSFTNYTLDKTYESEADISSNNYVPSIVNSYQNGVNELVKGSDGSFNNSGHYKDSNVQINIENEIVDNEIVDKKEVSINSDESLSNEIDKKKDSMQWNTRDDSLEEYYDDNNNVQSLFKVSTGKIMQSLSVSDKLKLLYVSMKLGKDNYKKVETYLYADDASDGVIKALKLLRGELADNEYKKVRKIAGRFIDMDAVENLD